MSPAGSEEVLIKERVLPVFLNGQIEWRGQGRNTVVVQQIRERFESLKIKVDWSRIDKIRKYRNDIEHYYSSQSRGAIRGIIADCFLVIRDFVRDQLHLDPLSLFDPDVWKTLTSVAEVYQKEKDECTNHIKVISLKYAILTDLLPECSCPECGSDLIDANPNCRNCYDAIFTCLACGETFDFETLASWAISERFADENHRSIQDGGEPLTIHCPHCLKETYLEDDSCVICEEHFIRECEMCGNDIPLVELGASVCSYCSHMVSKDD